MLKNKSYMLCLFIHIVTISYIICYILIHSHLNFIIKYSQDLDRYYINYHYISASSLFIKGKLKQGECQEYVFNLRNELYFRHDIFANFIYYEWDDYENNLFGAHVITTYYINNQQYAVDNQTLFPINVTNLSELEIVRKFTPQRLHVNIIKNDTFNLF
jgi:hypothetical protein